MPNPSGGYDPYATYGTPPSTGATSVPAGGYDLYLPTNLANQPIFVGTNSKPIRWDSRGDDFTPSPITVTASKLVQTYAGLSVTDPNAFASVQALLYASGAYGSKPLWGVWTSKDSAAFGNALTSYLQVSNAGSPITFSEWLSRASEQGKKDSAGATTQSTVADPAAIRQAAQQAAQASLGRGLTETELSSFVKSFQASQVTAQTSTGATVTAPDLSSDAMQFAQQTDPGAYQAQQHNSYTNALLNMFLPSSSARPNMTPVPSA